MAGRAVAYSARAAQNKQPWGQEDGIVPSTDEVEPAINDLFSAPPGDAVWARRARFDFGEYFPLLIAYLAEQGISPEWMLLWAGAGRHSVGHFLINTSTTPENVFPQSRPVTCGQMAYDPMVVIEKLVGLPYVVGSVVQS